MQTGILLCSSKHRSISLRSIGNLHNHLQGRRSSSPRHQSTCLRPLSYGEVPTDDIKALVQVSLPRHKLDVLSPCLLE